MACGEARQASGVAVASHTTEPQPPKILDLVQLAGLMERLCTTIGEVSLSPAAAAYEP